MAVKRKTASKDMGRDATSGYLSSNTNVHRLFARDVTAYTLSYYDRDYRPINGSSFEIAHAGDFNNDARNLYNGNIRSLVSSIGGMKTMGKAFHYDQLQRLTQMRAYIWDGNENYDWSTSTATDDYFNSYRYDKNGNLRNLQRNGVAHRYLEMDNFEYVYNESLNSGNNNRLSWVIDHVGASMYDNVDIDNSMSAGNYTYDALGQLLSDTDEHINSIDWRYGDKKIKKITRTSNEYSMLDFVYNPFGQRVLKIEKPNNGTASQNQWKYTYYAYDANGQVMAVYDVAMSESNVAYLSEQHLYGASRLGIIRQEKRVYSNGYEPIESSISVHIEGQTYYELTNYLGNVEAVITDRKTWEAVETESFYQVALIQEADYYPFGMVMPGRNKMDGKYRYGYNGMEMDNETKGIGNSYTTEFRQYDPRLGRWLSLDPLMHQFPWQSPYCAFDNNPIYFIDPYGLASGGPDDPEECDDESGDPDYAGMGLPEKPENNTWYTDNTGHVWLYYKDDWHRHNANTDPNRLGIDVYPEGVLERKVQAYLTEKRNETSIMGQFYAGGSNLKPFVDPLRTIPNHPNAEGWLYWRAWGNATEKIVGATFTVGIVAPVTIAGAVTTAPVWAPFAWQGVRYLGTRTLQGLRAYNNTFGKTGGYANMVTNYFVQSGQTGSMNPMSHNMFGYVGSAFTPSSIYGQMTVGAAGGMINYTPNAQKPFTGIWSRHAGITMVDMMNGGIAPIYGLMGRAHGFVWGTTHQIVGGRAVNNIQNQYDKMYE